MLQPGWAAGEPMCELLRQQHLNRLGLRKSYVKVFAILIATDTIKRGIPENELSPKTFVSFLSSARYRFDTVFAEYL
jgi:hypothetical protein